MLAMANKKGSVFGSIPGLANRARVPVEAVREAIAKFQQPDPDSRTKDFEGRRIVEIDGGWKLINYEKHRAIRDEEERREYMANLMREKRRKIRVSNVSQSEPPLSQAEAEAETERSKAPPSVAVESPTDVRKRADFGKYLIDHSVSIDDLEYDRKTFDLIRRSALRSGMSYTEAKEILGKDAKWRKWKWFDLIDSQETIEFPETPLVTATVAPPEDNKHGITVQMAAQAFMLDAGLNNPKTYVIVENCIGSYLRHNPGSNPIAAKESIQALWKEYKESNIHAKCSVTTWLGDSANFLKPETWRPKPKEPEKSKPQNGFKPASKTPEWAFRKPE